MKTDNGHRQIRAGGRGALLPVLLLAALPVFPSFARAAKPVVIDDFANGLSPAWKEKEFSGRTSYEVVEVAGKKCIRAQSDGTASGLFYEIGFDPAVLRHISWEWRIDNTVQGGDASRKSGDDYAARVYVVFPGFFFWQTRALNYVWANRLKKGEMVENAYTGSAMMIAVESGPENAGRFVRVERDLYRDFQQAFGTEPPMAGAVAIMTDTDDTGSAAGACYGPITLSP